MKHTNRKGAGRYLSTGNHSGCDAVHIPKRRCVLRQTFQQSGLHAAQSGNRAEGLPERSNGLCVYASLSLIAPTLPSAASACHSECHSEYRRHTESLHGAVFLNLPRKRCKKSGIAPNGTIPDFCLFSANDVCKRSHIKGLQVSSRFVNAQKIAHISFIAACVAWKKRRNQPLDCRNLSSLAYLQYYTIKMLIFQYVEQKKAPAQNEQEPLFTHII